MAKLACGQDQIRLSAYRDGELPIPQRQEMTAHLGHCDHCRAELQKYERLSQLLSSSLAVPQASFLTRTDLDERLSRNGGTAFTGLVRVTGLTTAAMATVMAVGVLTSGPLTTGGFQGLPFAAFGPSPGLPAQVSAIPNAAAVPEIQMEAIEPAAPVPSTASTSSRCAQALPGVASMLAERPELQDRLGCATDAARMLGLVSQKFERGSLLRRSDTREVYAIGADGQWIQYRVTDAHEETVLVDSLEDEPIRLNKWFGGLWSESTDLPLLLGPAAGTYRQVQGLVQPYEGGLAIWDDGGQVFLLIQNGESVLYLDQHLVELGVL